MPKSSMSREMPRARSPVSTSTAVLRLGNEAGFGHFQTELATGCTGLQEQGLHVIGEAWTRELSCGEVDADEESAVVGIVVIPSLNLVAGLGKAPVADGQNQTALFGMGDEIHRGDEAAFGMNPANESLDADDFAGGKIDLGLVVKDKLAAIERATEIAAPGPCFGGRAGECRMRTSAGMFGCGTAQLSQLQQTCGYVGQAFEHVQLSSVIPVRGCWAKTVKVPMIWRSGVRTGTPAKKAAWLIFRMTAR